MSIQTQIYKPERIHYKRCPNCQSFFLTDTECESCGLQINFDRMGKPFDERSFYFYQEGYWDSQPFYVKWVNGLENKKSELAQSYKRQLEYRFNDFMKYKDDWFNNDLTPQYLLELSELIKEMVHYNISPNFIMSSLERKKLNLQFAQLVFDLEEELQSKKMTVSKLMNYRVLGVLSIKYIIPLLISFCIMLLYFYKLIGTSVENLS